jgi:hypothetical protein
MGLREFLDWLNEPSTLWNMGKTTPAHLARRAQLARERQEAIRQAERAVKEEEARKAQELWLANQPPPTPPPPPRTKRDDLADLKAVYDEDIRLIQAFDFAEELREEILKRREIEYIDAQIAIVEGES